MTLQALTFRAPHPWSPSLPGAGSRELTRTTGREARPAPCSLPGPQHARSQGPELTRHGRRIPPGLEATGLGQERVVEPERSDTVRGNRARTAAGTPRCRSPRRRSPERVGLLHHLHLGGTCGRGPYGEHAVRRRACGRGEGTGRRGLRDAGAWAWVEGRGRRQPGH